MKVSRVKNMIGNLRNWQHYLLYKISGKKNPEFTFKLKHNRSVTVPKRLIPEFKESFFAETYTAGLPAKLLDIKNPVIIDIGANVGFFTLYSLTKFNNPRLISFEPIEKNYRQLIKNVPREENKNVHLINKAVSDTEGEIHMMLDSSADFTTSATIFNHTREQDRVTIKSTTLPKVFENYKLQKVDLLKLDCEGAEYCILYNTPSALFDKINCIALETHPGMQKNENNEALAGYLKTKGFIVNTKGADLIWGHKPLDKWV
jgi:FkbM family methyltransferase